MGEGQDEETIQETLRAHLCPPGVRLGAQEDLFAHGYLTSLRALQLVRFIERRFGLALEDEDLSPLHFRTLLALSQMIARRAAAPRA